MTGRAFAKALLLVVLVATGVRVTYVLAVVRHDDAFYDAFFYELQARALADGRGFVVPFPGAESAPAADHPPLTSLVLVPSAWLTGDAASRMAMRLTMVAAGLGAVVLVGLLGRALAGPRAGLAAAGLAAVDPNLWMNDGLLMAESLTALLVAAALVLAYRALRTGEPWVVAAVGAVLGLAALTRSELAVLVPALAVPVALVATRGRPHRARLASVALALLVPLAVVSPWVGRNLVRFDEPTFLSTGDGLALLGANCDATYRGDRLGLWTPECLPAQAPPGDQSVVSRIYRREALDHAWHHLGRLPVVAVARLGRVTGAFRPVDTARWVEGEGRPAWASLLGFAAGATVVVLAVVGAVALGRSGTPRWPLLVTIVLAPAIAVAFHGQPRFRTVAEPALLALAAVAITAWPDRRRVLPQPSPPAAERGGAGLTSGGCPPRP